MAKHAIENGVSLVEDLSDGDRKDAANAIVDTNKKDGVDGNRSYDEMIERYNLIIPYIQNEKLRPPVGLWREHIALVDIYKYKLKKTNDRRRSNSDHYNNRQRKIDSLEKNIREANNLVQLSEQSLITSFGKDYGADSNDKFNSFKSNYDILYQKYMHRSHFPFNTGIVKGYKIRDIDSIAMAIEEANENFWFWKRSESDNRPHRDLFYNQYKNFEQLNNKKEWHGNYQAKVPAEFFPLQSAFWEDENRD